MSIIESVRNLEKKLLFTIIGIIIGAIGLYLALHVEQPNIAIVNTNISKVLDVHEPLEELSISFQGKDIEEENLNLGIYTIRIENNGDVDILQGHFDTNVLWGIKFENGEIIETRFITSNSDYISSNINIEFKKEENVIEFSKIIFEKDKYFVIEALVLHEKETVPKIVPLGKIAGIDKIMAESEAIGKDEASFVDRLLQGTTLVHFVRAIGYFLTFAASIAVIALTAIGVNKLVDKKRIAGRKNELTESWEKENVQTW